MARPDDGVEVQSRPVRFFLHPIPAKAVLVANMRQLLTSFTVVVSFALCLAAADPARAADPPDGFAAVFDGKSLDGWHARPHFSPIKLAEMSDADREAKLAEWMADAREHWTVEDGELVNDGHGPTW